jgi:hypothetical protein
LDVYNFKPASQPSYSIVDQQGDEEVFELASRMLAFACMHLIDGHPVDLDALRKLRYAQRALISERRLKQVEDALDRNHQHQGGACIQFGSGVVWGTPQTGVTATSTYVPFTVQNVTVTMGKP